MAMSVSKKRLIEILPEVEDYVWVFYTEPDDFGDMLQNYAVSKLWRLNNLYTVVNKEGHLVPFIMNEAQLIVYAKRYRHGRQLILKSRQRGISTYYLVDYFDDAVHIPHFTVGMQAQGREESATLLERVKRLWEHLDPNYKMHALGGLERIADSTTKQAFSNDSTIYIRTSFRSATLHDLHVSEFGKTAHKYPEKAAEIISGSLEACAPRKGNNICIESTAEGEDQFKVMWDEACSIPDEQRSPEDFVPIFLSWTDDPDCTNDVYQPATEAEEKYFQMHGITDQRKKNFYIAKKRRLGPRITKEYPTTAEEAFQAALELAFYANYYYHIVERGGIVEGLYEPSLPVYAAVDLGISQTDLFTVIYLQELGDDLRIIGEDYGSDEAIPYYCDLMRRREWEVDTVYLPHDANVRSLNDKKTRKTAFIEEGFRVSVVKRSGLMDGIDRVRQYLPVTQIDKSCTMVQKMMLNYVKEWDEKLQLAKTTPKHNFWSHMADALRTGVMGLKHTKKRKVVNTSEKSNYTIKQRKAVEKRRRARLRRAGGI
jgi:hypothetical protein